MEFINVGFNNLVSLRRVISVVSPDSAPVKRIVQRAREQNMLIDASFGRRSRSVLVTDSDHVILSALEPEELAARAADTQEERKDG